MVITRPRAQAGALARLLARDGAKVVFAPSIRIEPPRSFRSLDAALRRLETYDWVVFTSQNGVQAFFARAKKLRLRVKAARSAAVGRKTAAALAVFGWKAATVPGESTGAALARAIPIHRGDRVLLPRAQKAGADLPTLLRRRGAVVDLVTTYRTVADARGAARVRSLAAAGRLDAVTFTSASTAEHLSRGLGAARFKKLFAAAGAASIGPVTSAALRKLGARPFQARAPSDESLADALRAHFS